MADPAVANHLASLRRDVNDALFSMLRASLESMAYLSPLFTVVNSNTDKEKYAFLSALTLYRRFYGNDVPVADLPKAYTSTVVNQEYGNSFEIPLNYFEDLQGAAPGARNIYTDAAREMGEQLGYLPYYALKDILLETTSVQGVDVALTSPDGSGASPFLASGSGHFSDNIINKITGATGYAYDGIIDDHNLAVDAFYAMKKPNGEDLHKTGVNTFVYFVDPEAAGIYRSQLQGERVAIETRGTSTSAVGGVSNPYPRGSITVVPLPFLRNQNRTFVVTLDRQHALGGNALAPFIRQVRKAPTMETLGVSSEHATTNRSVLFQVTCREQWASADVSQIVYVTKS